MGGSARSWKVRLSSPLRAGTRFTLRLVMTKFGDPSVRIGYSVSLG